MSNRRRISLWMPAVATLLIAIGIRYENFKAQEAAIIADVSQRKSYDAQLMADYLGAVTKGMIRDREQQESAIKASIVGRHRSTLAIVKMPNDDGEHVDIANNREGLKNGLFIDTDQTIQSLVNRRNGQDAFPPEGINFTKHGHQYLMHLRTFPVTIPGKSPGSGIGINAEVILVTDITAATESTRQTAIFWGSTLIIVVALGICGILTINVQPFERLNKSVQTGEPITIPTWWPSVAARLGYAIERYRAEVAENSARLEAALALAKRMAHEVETVNHIAVHDIKADLTALNKGSEAIAETVAELRDYMGAFVDDVVADGVETIDFFAKLNINSASNAFEVLDQRNKLYNLEERIEIAPVSVASIFDSLRASFSGEPGELRLENNCQISAAIKVDGSLMLGVFKNIIRNGFIHNDSTFKSVSVGATQVGRMVVFTIEDNGVGMPASYLQSWGATLGKSSQLDSKRGGSGTGLYSIRAVIAAHRGVAVHIDSTVGKGTKFTLEFV